MRLFISPLVVVKGPEDDIISSSSCFFSGLVAAYGHPSPVNVLLS